MADVSTLFDSRWLTAKHVGAAKPYIWVGVRRGSFHRGYHFWPGNDVNAIIPNAVDSKGIAEATWMATWVPAGDGSWTEIPNVYRVQLQQDFSQNGITTLTMDIENILYRTHVGGNGLPYSTIERGALAPLRGYQSPSRMVGPIAAQNEWYMVLERNAEILIKCGYGPDTAVGVFKGLIDKNQGTGNPARLTVSGRDFGKTLTDQYAFGNVVDKGLPDPITFADRRSNDKTFVVGGDAHASSTEGGTHPQNVCDDHLTTVWRSPGVGTSNWTEWIDIALPEGRYEDFFLAPQFSNLDVYVSLHATKRSGNKLPTFNGLSQPVGWMNIDTGVPGNHGTVPGDHGGVPYFRRMPNGQRRPAQYSLLGSFVVGDGSRLRISFRNLQRSTRDNRYHAGVRTLRAIRRRRNKEAIENRWVLVDDLADIVKVVLRWAGFKEWNVEQTGVRLKKNNHLVYNRQQHLMDIIQNITTLTGFVFFVDDPTSDDSLGVPTFRQPRAMIQNPGTLRGVRDSDLLTSATASYDDSALSYPIRVRGAIAKKSQGGRTLGGDSVRRYHGFYVPPWTDRLAGLFKHVIHYEPLLTSNEQCQMLCYLIAFQEALASSTAQVEFPAHPSATLDSQFAVLDEATGTSTRLYVASRTQVFQTGGGTSGGTAGSTRSSGLSTSTSMSWSMTLQGALLDTPDVQDVLRDMLAFMSDTDGVEDVPTVIGGRPQPGSSGPRIISNPGPTVLGGWPQEAG